MRARAAPSRRLQGILVMVSINKKNFKPSLKDVKERYYQKFRNSAKASTSGAGPSSGAGSINVQVMG